MTSANLVPRVSHHTLGTRLDIRLVHCAKKLLQFLRGGAGFLPIPERVWFSIRFSPM